MEVSTALMSCFMALLLLLYHFSAIGRYYIKFTYFIAANCIAATAPIPLMLRRPRDYRNSFIPSKINLFFANLMGITWEVRGLKNIDNTIGNIVLINHQSGLDMYPLSVAWPLMNEATIISKKILFYLWPFGLATWLWGTVFIDRSSKVQAKETVNQTVTEIQVRKAKIVIFPEGTRHGGDKLLPFKKGAFHAALDAGCPIQPVVVSKYYFLDWRRYKFSSGHFILSFLPLVSTEGMTKDDLPRLLETCQNLMQDEYNKISAEVLMKDTNNNKTASKKCT